MLTVFGLAIWAVSGFNPDYLLGPILFFAMALPIASVWKCAQGWPRKTMIVFAAFMGLIGAGTVLAVLADTGKLGGTLASAFAIGFIACPWLTNGLAMVKPRR